MNHARWLALLTILIGLFGRSSPAEACTCVQTAPAMLCAQRSSPVIFIGRVTKAVNDERVRVTVLEGFKGVADGSVVELPSGNGSMCGYDFEVGAAYLIFASRTESGGLGTGLCSGNRRLSEVSTAILNDLLDLQRGYGRAEIIGALVQARAGDGPFPPLPNIRVTASRGGKSFHAMTNKQGRFRIGLDGPGDFSISADLPAALTLAQANVTHATVVAQACTWVDLTAVNNARISGRLIAPAGVDVQGIPINVTSTDARMRGLGVETGADGRYEIAGIEPGEYVLGINSLASRTRVYRSRRRRAMLAGTVDVTSAERLNLVRLETGEDGRIDVPLPVGRIVLLAARDASCSTVPIVVETTEPIVRWRRLNPDETLSTWRAAGPFDRTDGLELVLERVAPWCR